MVTGSLSRRGGGVFKSVSCSARAVKAVSGATVTIYGLQDGRGDASVAEPHGIDGVTELRAFGPRAFGFAPSLIRQLCSARLDVLHLHGLWMYASVASLAWSWSRHRPIVISPHGMLDPWALSNPRWKKRIAAVLYEHRNLRQAACILALSKPEARAIRVYGLENPICIIPNGVALPSVKTRVRPPWEGVVPSGFKVLLYLGRLHPKKNVKSLLDAWAGVAREREVEDWTLVIVGWGQSGYEQVLKTCAGERQVPRVWFAGPRFDLDKEACLANADAFVLPSRSEGLPMAVLEAWAHQLPVLMTAACNLPEGFKNRAALRISEDVVGIADGICELASLSATQRKVMGNRGRKLVEDNYAWPRVGQQLSAVYQWVLGEGDEPSTLIS